MALCSLATQSLANFNSVRKQSNCRCPLGVCFRKARVVSVYQVIHWLFDTYSLRGLLRCSTSTEWAMRDALSSGTSDKYRLSRFFLYLQGHNYYYLAFLGS